MDIIAAPTPEAPFSQVPVDLAADLRYVPDALFDVGPVLEFAEGFFSPGLQELEVIFTVLFHQIGESVGHIFSLFAPDLKQIDAFVKPM